MLRLPSSRLRAVWLGTPDAATRFDPSRLDSNALAEWAALRTSRRRLDYASSRALMAAIPVTPCQTRSLSHSRGFAAVAVAHEPTSVGVDVESLVPRDFKSMARLAYSAPEADFLESLENPSTLCASFYEFWTLKEAFAKALRLHLADALRQCCFIDVAGQRRAEIPTAQQWKAMVFAPRPTLRLAVAWIAASTDLLNTNMHTAEWPEQRTQPWTPVLDISSNDAPCVRSR